MITADPFKFVSEWQTVYDTYNSAFMVCLFKRSDLT